MPFMNRQTPHGVTGRTAVITGASSGIGKAFAQRLASEGCRLVIAARRKDLLAELAEQLEATHGVKVEPLAVDLSTLQGISRLERRIASDPHVEMLVNCAGFGTRGLYHEVAPDRIEAMITLHVLAPSRLIRAALPNMREAKKGYIINVSSIGAFLTTSRYVTYSATKAFLNMFTLGLADECRGSGVVVQALCPGLTRTGFMHTEEYRDFHYDKAPDFVWMTPEEVVDESLRALPHGKTIVIPGRLNRLFLGALRTPGLKQAIGLLLRLSGGDYY